MRLAGLIFPVVQAQEALSGSSLAMWYLGGFVVGARAVKADWGNAMLMTHSQEKAVMGH